ncbi:riboflavin biosynthesis protein RibF [uncultured Phascolarctobacterium sp.]|jgi:riboflavin kinase/FMN adenylyltransferase|uniref:riboflavin biosynthesis protein RibF n=1 Tax=uncultured Phascolarctobacterium sp. TaxID=512296 RepID=UPI0025CEB9EA|nr:riboflavin biosynthesis protein RibF [uncultured Phascolarctobacterium sp.]
MEIITSLEQLHSFAAPCVVALGTFDGLHRGHLDVIGTAKQEAQHTGAKLAVFTFSNHPLEWINPAHVPVALVTPAVKLQLLENLGVDVLIDIPFNQLVADLLPQQFLERLRALNYSCLVVGENFTYGQRGVGNVYTLAASAQALGFKLIVRKLVSNNGTIISSTEIRRLITDGEVQQAAKMLGRSYSISGIVAHGNERGRLLGYPTANLELVDAHVAIPLGGVYAVRAYVDGCVYGGMANIGKNPTFGDVEKPRLETNIFGFSDDIYGKTLTIEFVQRIRGEVKFTGIDALKEQLAQDKLDCLKFL